MLSLKQKMEALQEQHRRLMDEYNQVKSKYNNLNNRYSTVCEKYCKIIDNMPAVDAKSHKSVPIIAGQKSEISDISTYS